jgi:hypothetical protein
MRALIAKRPLISLIVAVFAGALLMVAAWGIVTASSKPVGAPSGIPAGPAPETATPAPTDTDEPAAPVGGGALVGCGTPTATVSDAEDLTAALAGAKPGDVIQLEPGRYVGNFVASASGTADSPIELCGTVDSVLDGDDPDDGYVFHLDQASYWRLAGFSVTNGQKGVMADTTVGSVIEGLTVSHIGDEAIHLRQGSTDNSVVGNTISDTGLRREKFGEGIYIGTAKSNWCDVNDCQPDASDRNLVEGNTIFGTTAENIDIKEGSSNGIVRGNSLDGTAITEDGGDSWVDVKGNGYLIEGNIGANSPMDGFQTHEILDGWGTENIFRSNTAAVDGPGFGYSLTPELDNVVECSNTASGAAEGFTNVTCTG